MNPLVLLAKTAVENYIEKGEIIPPPSDLPEEFLKKRGGVFVSIFRSISENNSKHEFVQAETEKQLRGCIGTYLPTKTNIAEEIISNAISAASNDYRFEPIKKEELPYLSYTVYILSKPELIKNISELDPKKFGIIVKTIPISSSNQSELFFNGHFSPKSGLLLPDLEGVDTVEQQISIACQKAGINPNREKIIIYKFTAEKYQ